MDKRYAQFFSEIKDGESWKSREKNDKVLVIDGLNTFIRNWSSIPTMNDNGDHVAGVTNVLMSIGKAIKEVKPTRVIIVFDGKDGSRGRKNIYSGYKSKRGKNKLRVNRSYHELMTVEDERESMKRQFSWLTEFLHVLPVTTMIYDGVEADDVMAYIIQYLLKPGEKGVIMSTDKDFLQLVNEDITVWSPTKKLMVGVDEVISQFGGIRPKNLLLFRVLDGDVSDEIPGVNGVGLKTLVKRFPEITMDEELTVDDFLKLTEEKSGSKVKLYKTILESKDIISRNEKLMQLKEPLISGPVKMNILSTYDEPIKKLNKIEFMKLVTKYGVSDKFTKNLHGWLRDTFETLITDN